jgi:hypothetical protein
MSLLKSKETNFTLDLSAGVSLFAVLRVEQQKRQGRKVIFEAGHISGPGKLTVGLDHNDNLNVWLIDTEGKEVCGDPIEKHIFFEKFVYLCCLLSQSDGEGKSILTISIDDDHRTQKTISGSWGDEQPARFTIGADLGGKENAAFSLAEFVQTKGVPPKEQLVALRTYIKQRYKI